MKNKVTLLFLSLVLCLFVGCAGFEERADRKSAEVDHEWATALGRDSAVAFNWDDALEYMFENNQEIRDAGKRLEFAAEQKRVVWKELIPRPTTSLSFTRLITELDSASAGDITSLVNLFVAIPNPVSYRVRLFRTEFSYRQAELDLEMRRRTALAQLYQLYFAHEALVHERKEVQALSELAGVSGNYLRRSREAENALRSEEMRFYQSMRDLMGNEYVYYEFLDSDNLPIVNLSDIDITDPEFGRLYRDMVALELLGAELSILGLEVADLPSFGVFLSTPPLYQDNGGQSQNFDFEQVRLNVSMFYTLDLSGSRALSIERAEYIESVLKKQVSGEMTDMIAEFEHLTEEAREYENLRSDLVDVLNRLSAIDSRESNRRSAQIRRQIANVDMSLSSLHSRVLVLL